MAAINMEDYPDYIVVLYNTKGAETVAGLLNNEEFSYQNAADVGARSLIAGITEVATGAANKLGGKLGGAAGDWMVRKATSQFSNIYSTMKSYEGAGDTPLSVTFHAFPENGSYQGILSKLYKYTQPDTESDIIIKSYLYDPSTLVSLDRMTADPFDGGLIHLSIGKWFHATGLMPSGVGLTFSKYVNEDKVPIYLEVSISLVPHIVQNAKQMLGWTG